MNPLDVERVAHLEQMAWVAAGLSHDFNNGLCCAFTEIGAIDARLVELRDAVAAGDRGASLLRLIAACRSSLAAIGAALEGGAQGSRELQSLYRGQVPSRPAPPADLRRAAGRAVHLARGRLRGQIGVEGDRIEVAVGEHTLVRVLLNLLINAADAFGPATAGARVRIAIAIAEAGTHAICDVSDNGPGVPPSLLPRLFSPFASGKPDGAGHGLGLAVSRDLLRGAGGELTLHATGAAGSTFRLELPLAR